MTADDLKPVEIQVKALVEASRVPDKNYAKARINSPQTGEISTMLFEDNPVMITALQGNGQLCHVTFRLKPITFKNLRGYNESGLSPEVIAIEIPKTK